MYYDMKSIKENLKIYSDEVHKICKHYISLFLDFYTTTKERRYAMCVYTFKVTGQKRDLVSRFLCWVFMNSEATVGSIRVHISRLQHSEQSLQFVVHLT